MLQYQPYNAPPQKRPRKMNLGMVVAFVTIALGAALLGMLWGYSLGSTQKSDGNAIPGASAASISTPQTDNSPFGYWVEINPASVVSIQLQDAGNNRITGTLTIFICRGNSYNTQSVNPHGVVQNTHLSLAYNQTEFYANVNNNTLRVSLLPFDLSGIYNRASLNTFNQDVQSLKTTGCA